jgi:hypothetical protein
MALIYFFKKIKSTMESSSGSDVAKPELIYKLEGSTDEIHGAVVIPGKFF